MLPGDAQISPLSLTDRIVIALEQLRGARDRGDVLEEMSWQLRFDRLIDLLPRVSSS